MVGATWVEPARITPQDPKSCVSANSTTRPTDGERRQRSSRGKPLYPSFVSRANMFFAPALIWGHPDIEKNNYSVGYSAAFVFTTLRLAFSTAAVRGQRRERTPVSASKNKWIYKLLFRRNRRYFPNLFDSL
jgi:hypothetical protein